MAKVRREQGPAFNPFQKALHDLDKYQGRVGWLDSSKYPNGGPPVALVAAVNEFGWPEHNIPPRLGMRATAEKLKPVWTKIAFSANQKVLRGEMTAKQAMDLIGAVAAGDIRKHIAEVTQPPLKPATVEARLRHKAGYGPGRTKPIALTVAKPLVFTGRLEGTLNNDTVVK